MVPIALDQIDCTVLYDNTVAVEPCTSSWGFSALFRVGNLTILFDTGADGDTLLANMRKLEIDPTTINAIVLSHFHWDHMGGLYSLLHRCRDQVDVYTTDAFSAKFIRDLRRFNIKSHSIVEPLWINDHIYLSGPVQSDTSSIREQIMTICTEQGDWIVTGCAHPGIVHLMEVNAAATEQEPLFAMGGFHLLHQSVQELSQTMLQLDQTNVCFVGATHCTGKTAIAQLKDYFGDRFLPLGVGRTINGKDLVTK